MIRLERWIVRFGFALTLMTLLGILGDNLDLDTRPWWQRYNKMSGRSEHVLYVPNVGTRLDEGRNVARLQSD